MTASTDFCSDCGCRLTRNVAVLEVVCANVKCPSHIIPPSILPASEMTPEITEALERIVDAPSWTKAMADARRQHWNDIRTRTVPTNRDVILTREVTSVAETFWIVQRHRCNGQDTPYLNGRMATHWAEDILGTP